MKNRREERGEEGRRNKIITMFGDVEKATGLLSSVGIVPPPPLAGRRWWVGFARDRRRMGKAAESFLPSERFHHRGRNNGHPDPSKRDSGGKYVLVRAPSQVEGIHRWWRRRRRRRTRGRACSTGAPNPDDIAPRYTTRDFIAYYRTV